MWPQVLPSFPGGHITPPSWLVVSTVPALLVPAQMPKPSWAPSPLRSLLLFCTHGHQPPASSVHRLSDQRCKSILMVSVFPSFQRIRTIRCGC